MKMELETINVVCLLDNEIQSVYVYPNTPEGITCAELRFGVEYDHHNDPDGTTDEPKPTPEEMHEMFMSGTYDDENGFKICVRESDPH